MKELLREISSWSTNGSSQKLLVRLKSVEGNMNETIASGQNVFLDFCTDVIITTDVWS